MKIYLASPWFKNNERVMYTQILQKMRSEGHEVYAPVEHEIPNAWDLSNADWGREVFNADINAIRECDEVWVLNFGMYSDSGTAWECGFAYGLGKTVRDKIKSVLEFFNVNSLQELKIKFISDVDPAFFRKSLKLENNPVNIFTWKAIAYMKSDMERCSKTFNPDTLEDVCEKLSEVFLENTNTLTKIQEVLGAYGIKFLIMDNEKGTHIDGFSFIRNCTPTIVLTLRNKKIDILAFTLLHELYHVYTHLDNTDENIHQITLADYKESIEEIEADTFAKNTLISPREWQIFKTRVKGMSPYAVASQIRAFALENGIHPAIVLGRYQHDFNVYDNGRGFDRSIN